MNHRPLVLAAGCAAALSAVALAGQPAPKGGKDASEAAFKVAVRAKLTMTVGGQEEKIEADAAFQYTWKRDGKVKTLVVDSAEVRAVSGGREMMNAKMSRAGFEDIKGGQTVKIEDAPDQLKRMLTDAFGSPVCKVELDDAGKELKRTVVAGRGAAPLIENGMVANTLMVHPWYPADKNEWQADLEVSAGQGLASGKATYTKVPGGKGGQAVKVAGTLTADGVKGAGGLTIKDGKYVVSGEQTYDTTRKEWVAGKLNMDVSFKMVMGETTVGSATGTMAVTFEMLPGKK
jgi:hypothetical protein